MTLLGLPPLLHSNSTNTTPIYITSESEAWEASLNPLSLVCSVTVPGSWGLVYKPVAASPCSTIFTAARSPARLTLSVFCVSTLRTCLFFSNGLKQCLSNDLALYNAVLKLDQQKHTPPGQFLSLAPNQAVFLSKALFCYFLKLLLRTWLRLDYRDFPLKHKWFWS